MAVIHFFEQYINEKIQLCVHFKIYKYFGNDKNDTFEFEKI